MTEIETIVRQLAGYDMRTLAEWSAILNSWQWPDECPVPKPAGFDAPGADKGALGQPFWAALDCFDIPHEEMSLAHWRLVLGKTDEEWVVWYDARAGRGLTGEST